MAKQQVSPHERSGRPVSGYERSAPANQGASMTDKSVPSRAVSNTGPKDATGKVSGHFKGRSGKTWPGPSVGDPDGDGDNDRTMSGQRNNANPVTG